MSRAPQLIAIVSLRRSLRVLVSDLPRLLAISLLGIVGVLPIIALAGMGSFAAGQSVRLGAIEDLGESLIRIGIGGGVTATWLSLWGLAVVRTVTQSGRLELPEVELLGTSLRNVVLGVLAAELIRFLVVVIPLSAFLGACFAAGAQQYVFALLVPLLAMLLVITAVPLGFLSGLSVRHLMLAYRPVAQLRVPLVVALVAGYIAILLSDRVQVWLFELASTLSVSPLAWPGELLVLGLPDLSANPWAVSATVGVSGVVVLVVVVLIENIAAVHWYHDRPHPRTSQQWSSTSLVSLDRYLARRVSRPVRSVCISTLRRTLRAPVRMLYVAYPVLGSIVFLVEIIRRGEVPFVFLVLLGVYVVWGTGALVTLNPLGDLGAVIAGVVPSPLTGYQLMSGYRLAAWLVGIPFAIAISVLAVLVGQFSYPQLIGLGLGTIGGTLLAPSLALGIGALFPRFGAVRVTNKREAVMPSKLAFLTYTSVLSIPAMALTVLATPEVMDLLVSLMEAQVQGIADIGSREASVIVHAVFLVPVLLSFPLPFISFRYACYRFDRFVLP